MYWVYLYLQGITALAYFMLPVMRKDPPVMIMGVPWSAYCCFIFFCGLHHAGCLTMAIDMPGHVAMMYQGELGMARMGVDLLMASFSVMAWWMTFRHD